MRANDIESLLLAGNYMRVLVQLVNDICTERPTTWPGPWSLI